jgi:FAD/FMN-containing dehydrogenase
MIEVNDVQSKANPTYVTEILTPTSLDAIFAAVNKANRSGNPISIAGGRHAMGSQQFGTETSLIDMCSFNQVVHFDKTKGLIKVESGIMWPELIEYLHKTQVNEPEPWGIRQKQTGVDLVTIGGSLASNIHGRGLTLSPFVSDIESFTIVNASGHLLTCNRIENQELFSLAIGGYGLFGIVAHITLRLVPRVKIKRLVEIIAVRNLLPRVDALIEEGYLFGDCQYSIYLDSDEEFHPGVFSCYKPVDSDTQIFDQNKQLSTEDWAALYTLARRDKKRAFDHYAQYYLGTSGQTYWSDVHQLSNVFEGYKNAVEQEDGTEIITEVYVSRDALVPFLTDTRRDLVKHNVDITYGTIRFIEKDSETFLSWAKESSVCIVCNLHVKRTDDGRKKAGQDFQRIIDRAIQYGGRFYLTYHRWATAEQIETCYPEFREFLAYKDTYDPEHIFQSDWYHHNLTLFPPAG